MSIKFIIPKIVAEETATAIDIRITGMPLVNSSGTMSVFYGFYKESDLRIEDSSAEGNYSITDAVSSGSRADILMALEAEVGSVTDATLVMNQLNHDEYYIRYLQAGEYFTTKINGNFISDSEYGVIRNAVLTPLEVTFKGLNNRKQITVSSTSSLSGFAFTFTIHNGEGTDTNTDIYVTRTRDDWGDIRFKKPDGIFIPFGILSETSTSVLVVFAADLAIGDNIFYLYYNKPAYAGDVIKFAVTTDQHYDTGQTYVGRDKTLLRLENWKTRMSEYLPDVILEGGDKMGGVTVDSTSQLGFMQAVSDKHTELATTLGVPCYLWGWGNHDFEHTTFTAVQAKYNGLTGQVAGTLYATWNDDNFTYISLDANYVPSGDTHVNLTNQGYGYINPAQLTWLIRTLDNATKPCIVLCHQPLGEEDTARLTLTKETYHTQNRAEVRDVLEASGKVLCVLQGHCHAQLLNIINGIPYITLVDVNELNDPEKVWDTPNSMYPTVATLNGRWTNIEIDKGSQIIRVIQETQIEDIVNVVYDFKVPYKTIYDNEYGSNVAKTFAQDNLAEYEKASVISDASDLYTNNYAYVIIKPACISDGDPILCSRTLKIIGRTNSPNYGRPYWSFAPQTGLFKVSFSVRLAQLASLYFKLFNSSASTTIGTYIGFKPNGNLDAIYNGSFATIVAYSINTWYSIEIIVNQTAKTYQVTINGVSKGSFNYYDSATTSPLNKLEILTETGDFFLDSFRIEKYATTQPSISAWSANEII